MSTSTAIPGDGIKEQRERLARLEELAGDVASGDAVSLRHGGVVCVLTMEPLRLDVDVITPAWDDVQVFVNGARAG